MAERKNWVVPSAFAHLNPNKQLGEGIVTAGFNRISYKGKTFSVVIDGVTYAFTHTVKGSRMPRPWLDVVFIGDNPKTSRTYYGQAYQEGSNSAPTCASIDGVVPDVGVQQPQSKACANCPRNQWLPAKKGKECKENRQTAVLLMPWMFHGKDGPNTVPPLPADIAPTTAVSLRIPPDSLKPYKLYGDYLRGIGMPFSAMVTRITLEPNELFQFHFDDFKVLTNDNAPVILPLVDAPETLRLIGGSAAPALPPPIRQPEVEDEEDTSADFVDRGRLAKGDELPTPSQHQANSEDEDEDETGDEDEGEDEPATVATTQPTESEKPKKGIGRPAGSRNKPKITAANLADPADEASTGWNVKAAGTGLDSMMTNINSQMARYSGKQR